MLRWAGLLLTLGCTTPVVHLPVDGVRTSVVTTSWQGGLAVRHPVEPAAATAVVLMIGAPMEEAPSGVIAVPVEYEGWLRREAHGERCWFPAGQLGALAREVELALGVGRVLPTWVVGQGVSGASIAVVTALQAPPGQFEGVVTVGFRGSLSGGRRPCGVDMAGWKATVGPGAPLVMVRPQADVAGATVADAVDLAGRLGR